MKLIALILALCAGVVSTCADAQPAPPGTTQVPKSPDERDWYPQSGIYSPEDLIGTWFWVDGTTLTQVSYQPSTGLRIETTFINSRAYEYSRTKDTEASAKIPAFASASLQDKESESITLDDISVAKLKTDVGEPFCREWPVMKTRRTWAVGDKLVYVVSDLLSHVSWKIGTEKSLDASVGVSDWFSAGGKQYQQSSVSAILPANSFPQLIHKTITAADIAGLSCRAGKIDFLKASVGQPRLMATKVVPLPAKK